MRESEKSHTSVHLSFLANLQPSVLLKVLLPEEIALPYVLGLHPECYFKARTAAVHICYSQ